MYFSSTAELHSHDELERDNVALSFPPQIHEVTLIERSDYRCKGRWARSVVVMPFNMSICVLL